MGALNNQRRYYLRKAQFAALFQIERDSLMRVYWVKQDALPGTPLPPSIPWRDLLTAAHYTALEDLQGADVAELVSQGLGRSQAAAVVAAAAGPLAAAGLFSP